MTQEKYAENGWSIYKPVEEFRRQVRRKTSAASGLYCYTTVFFIIVFFCVFVLCMKCFVLVGQCMGYTVMLWLLYYVFSLFFILCKVEHVECGHWKLWRKLLLYWCHVILCGTCHLVAWRLNKISYRVIYIPMKYKNQDK